MADARIRIKRAIDDSRQAISKILPRLMERHPRPVRMGFTHLSQRSALHWIRSGQKVIEKDGQAVEISSL
jgi:hypothetical protein